MTRGRSRLFALAAGSAAALGVAAPLSAQSPSEDGDVKISGQAYVRHDGGVDLGIGHCNDTRTDPAGDNNPNDTDVDSNDGGSRRQGNEPYTVIDPTNPNHVYAGWNDYCLSDLGAGWQGFAYSLDAGATWTDSIVPGYPQDTSSEGMASPLFGTHTDAGDPIAAFDQDGNLFVGGISFNREKPANGDVYVATYGTSPHDVGVSGRLPPHRDRRPGNAVGRAGRHLPGQADARGRPHGRPQRRERVRLLEPLHRGRRAEQGVLHTLDRFRGDVLTANLGVPVRGHQVCSGL